MKKYNLGITWGCFDGLSEAHLQILEQARSKCKKLIIGVSNDNYIKEKKKQKPILDEITRKLILSKFADIIVPQASWFSKKDAVDKLKPDVIFVGKEYQNKDWEGKELGLPIIYIKHNKTIHSTKIRKYIK
jgi:cytidyltransferase-like protein